MAIFPNLGQRGALPRGVPVEGAAGNATVTEGPPRSSWWGRRGIETNPVAFSVPHAPNAVQAGGAHRLLQVRERHPYLDMGTARKNDQPSNSGVPNPTASGPARPTLAVQTRNEAWQIGTDHAKHEDNTTAFPTVEIRAGVLADGRSVTGARVRALGTLGDTYAAKNGGTPGLYRPYGARGVVVGPPEGDSLDGPQKLRLGPPRGRHSPTIPDHMLARIKYHSGAPQQRGVRQNRPASSRIAGQAWSQFAARQGQDTPSPIPRMATARTPGLSGRWARR